MGDVRMWAEFGGRNGACWRIDGGQNGPHGVVERGQKHEKCL